MPTWPSRMQPRKAPCSVRGPRCAMTAEAAPALSPNNATWRVRQELKNQGIRNPDGTELTPADRVPGARRHASRRAHRLRRGRHLSSRTDVPIPPADTDPRRHHRGYGPADHIACRGLEPGLRPHAWHQHPEVCFADRSHQRSGRDRQAASSLTTPTRRGTTRSPCKDTSTPDPFDTVKLRFEQGVTIAYRLVVGNSGVQSLSSVTVIDSTGGTGCSFPGTFAVGYTQQCDYVRTAPNVVGGPNTQDYVNVGHDRFSRSPARPRPV